MVDKDSEIEETGPAEPQIIKVEKMLFKIIDKLEQVEETSKSSNSSQDQSLKQIITIIEKAS